MADHATANLDAVEKGKATNESIAPPQTSAATTGNPSTTGVPAFTETGGEGAKAKDNWNGKDGEENDDVDNKKDIENEKPKSVGVIKLFFKYATMLELLYMFLGTCFAVLTGWVYTKTVLGFVP